MNELSKNKRWILTILGLILAIPGSYYYYLQIKDPTPSVTNTINNNNVTNQTPMQNDHKEVSKPIVKHIPHQKEIYSNINEPKPDSRQNLPVTINQTQNEIKKPENENIKTDDYINVSTTKADIAIMILDNNNRSINGLTSDIATLYQNSSKGYSITTSLFQTTFLNSKYLTELISGNAGLIDKLNLYLYADFIVIGKYSSDIATGQYAKYLCAATLDVVIISCRRKSLIPGFTLSASNTYNDKMHAEKGAKEKLVDDYKTNHLNL